MRHKYFDTVIHTFLSALHGITQHYDSVLVCNAANAPFCPMLRLAGTPVAINVNGLDYKRKKWSRLGRSYYLLSERLAALLPNEIVTDARVIQDYYASRYGAPSKMIAYGLKWSAIRIETQSGTGMWSRTDTTSMSCGWSRKIMRIW